MTNSWRAACRYSYIASTTEPLNQELRRPLTSTAILSSFPVARLEAAREMEKDSSSAAASTRARVASLTSDDPRSARETVATETPANSATSCMLDRSFRAAPLYVPVGADGTRPCRTAVADAQPPSPAVWGRRPASAVTNCDQDN